MSRKLTVLITALIAIMLSVPTTVLWYRNTDSGKHWLEQQIEITSHRMLMRAKGDAVPMKFSTDGCSGGMSVFWRDLTKQFPTLSKDIGASPPWESCCIQHDISYFNAAATTTASDSFEGRVIADQALRNCVADFGTSQPEKSSEFSLLANAIYTAVRVGGAPCSGLAWRWGYGLPPCFVGHQVFKK